MTDASDRPHPVLVDRRGALCVLRMNRPRALNALNLELIEALTDAIKDAVADDSVKTLWLESSSEKAFCAGGDVKALYQGLAGADASAQRLTGYRYFLAEYRLDALIEHCPKPIVAWGDGLVMGGGWGLFAGADLRLVGERTRLAMPELQIGLFPDVGAAHFLQRPDWRIGTVLGISGVHLSAPEAVALGYADALTTAEQTAVLRRRLEAGEAPEACLPHPRPESAEDIRAAWHDAVDALPPPNLVQWMAHIGRSEFEPFHRAREQWQTGSALSIALTWVHFRRLREAGRTQALAEDLVVGANACGEREFCEGVRALLVDKDKSPQWQYRSVENVPYNLIERFYRPLPFEVERIGPEQN